MPLEFTVDELPLDITDVANLADAAAATRTLFKQLAVNTDMQLEAVRILNDLLDLAVMKAANLGVGNINRAFMKLREELVGDEIILLIEDVALIQASAGTSLTPSMSRVWFKARRSTRPFEPSSR